MYDKNLKSVINLRVSDDDYAFLSKLALDNSVSISCLIRIIIDFYRDFLNYKKDI